MVIAAEITRGHMLHFTPRSACNSLCVSVSHYRDLLNGPDDRWFWSPIPMCVCACAWWGSRYCQSILEHEQDIKCPIIPPILTLFTWGLPQSLPGRGSVLERGPLPDRRRCQLQVQLVTWASDLPTTDCRFQLPLPQVPLICYSSSQNPEEGFSCQITSVL